MKVLQVDGLKSLLKWISSVVLYLTTKALISSVEASADALTEKISKSIITAAKIGVDYLAVSFPRTGEDLNLARRLARDAG